VFFLRDKKKSILMFNEERDVYYEVNLQNKLTKQDIINQPQFADLNEEEIETLIEFIWDYSVIVYKAFKNKLNE